MQATIRGGRSYCGGLQALGAGKVHTALAALTAAVLVTKDRTIRANYPMAVW